MARRQNGYQSMARCPESGKVQHLTREDGKKAIRLMHRLAEQNGLRPARLRAYQCWTCRFWHVGSLPARGVGIGEGE